MAMVPVTVRKWDFIWRLQDRAESIWAAPEPITRQKYGGRMRATVSGSIEVPLYRQGSQWHVDTDDLP